MSAIRKLLAAVDASRLWIVTLALLAIVWGTLAIVALSRAVSDVA